MFGRATCTLSVDEDVWPCVHSGWGGQSPSLCKREGGADAYRKMGRKLFAVILRANEWFTCSERFEDLHLWRLLLFRQNPFFFLSLKRGVEGNVTIKLVNELLGGPLYDKPSSVVPSTPQISCLRAQGWEDSSHWAVSGHNWVPSSPLPVSGCVHSSLKIQVRMIQ